MKGTKDAIATLIWEVMRGTPPGADGTWFVQGGEALDATLAGLTAAQASWSPGPNLNTVAAHVIHTAYYLEQCNLVMKGKHRPSDWPGSWGIQSVTEAEWGEAKSNLSSQVRDFLANLDAEELTDEHLIPAIANVGHLAYHLGAIRQLSLLTIQS